MKVTVSRKAHFNAAHRLFNNKWSQKKNDIVFGKCNNPNFHGHNYELIVSVTGEINTDTGYVIDMAFLKDIIKQEVEDKLDHKNLNLDVKEFKSINPTAENICVFIYNRITNRLDSDLDLDLEITLYENPKKFCKIFRKLKDNTGIYSKIKEEIDTLGFNVVDYDFNRPWGGFLVIDEKQRSLFISTFFNDININLSNDTRLSPKILIVDPNSRLSWQYHFRRKEIWKIYRGSVGVIRSKK